MKNTWRWFGPKDKITISAMLQAGVEGVVTSLYHIPTGNVWSTQDIKNLQKKIAYLDNETPSGISWEVVESLPVSENIKTQTNDWLSDIEAYKESLRNLAGCGIKTVCYNFMPVLDWTRTCLRSKMASGGLAMRFDIIDFAVFDIHLLKRKNAISDFSNNIIEKAKLRFAKMAYEQQNILTHNIVSGLPGANDSWMLDDVRQMLAIYDNINADQLRNNLITFLKLVTPTAAEVDINLCCHPDDPPFSILGLPRIVSTVEDYAKIMQAVDIPQNGITLCTGSMGVMPDVNFAKFITDWGHRIHFAHLRNTQRDGPADNNMYSFFEAEHLTGDTNMIEVVHALLKEEERRKNEEKADWEIPMRPDHGQELLDDIGRNSLPGYPLIGRLRGLAELRGVIAALNSGLISH